MSTGETPPTPRFTSPSNTSNATKKYPGTPKSPLTTNSTAGNNRNSLARQRLLSGKVSAPRPMNLPSLRKEHSVGTEVLSSSPSTTAHGWGSSASSSPSNSFTQPSELEKKVNASEQPVTSPVPDPAENHNGIDAKNKKSNTSKADLASSSPPPSQSSTTTRAWAIPAKTPAAVQAPSTDFPTAAEAASKKKSSVYDDKEYLKYASSDPNHTSWDEMVSEDLDEFEVDVVEFDDGTKVQIEGVEESVNPSDRFTEDYDRSYPPKTTYHSHDDHSNHHHYKPNYRRSEDHGYNNARYNSNVHDYDNRRHSSATTNDRWNHYRRESADSNSNRRSSYDKKSAGGSSSSSTHHNNSNTYHSTVLQRPRRLSEQSFRSDHSREDTFHLERHANPLQIIPEPSTSSSIPPVAEEITAAQREVMLTAAERAKKRRDEEEAEFEAARIRARQKADALAEKARLEAEKSKKEEKVEPAPEKKSSKDIKPILKKKDSASPAETSMPTLTHRSSSTITDTSKPWNLVAANKQITIEKRPKVETTSEKEKEPVKAKEPEKEKEVPEPATEIEPPKFDKDGKPLTEDEQNWEVYVSKIKSDSIKPVSTSEGASNSWNSFATRLQQSVIDNQKAHEARHKAIVTEKQKEIVEEINYNEIEKSESSQHNNHGNGWGQQSRGWTRNEDEYGTYNRGERSMRGRGANDRSTRGARTAQGNNRRPETTHWRQSNEEHEKEPTPIVTEILKHEPVSNTSNSNSKKNKVTDLLKDSTSPVFPIVIQKLVGKKPANISFMIDVEESDKDITMMDVLVEDKEESPPVVAEAEVVQNEAKVEAVPVESDAVEEPSAPESETEDNAFESAEKPSASESSELPSTSEPTETTSAFEPVDETSATSSTASTPPRNQFQQHGHNKLGSSSPQRLNVNPNYPLLVYQYPVPQQQQQDQHTPVNGYSNGYSSSSKGHQQQRPMGVYLMPTQQYMTGNQYIVPYPQSGAGVQPMYYPAMPWQSQYNNGSSPRPHFEQRRSNNNNMAPNTSSGHMSKWEAHTNSVAYQSHRPAYSNFRGGYRKRGGWSSNNTRGRGGYTHQSNARRYPDVNTVSPPSEQHTSSSETNHM